MSRERDEKKPDNEVSVGEHGAGSESVSVEKHESQREGVIQEGGAEHEGEPREGGGEEDNG